MKEWLSVSGTPGHIGGFTSVYRLDYKDNNKGALKKVVNGEKAFSLYCRVSGDIFAFPSREFWNYF